MEQVLFRGMLLTVDAETAKALQDPHYADEYEKLLMKSLLEESDRNISFQSSCQEQSTCETTLWRSKLQTQTDHQATLILLGLRKTYNEQFNNKTICKNTLWAKIRDELNSMGFFVGEGVSGREKCRQKFSNLQAAYLKTKEKRNRTGEGKVEDSSYFKEVDAILGDKHKITPVLIIDSLCDTSSYLEKCSASKVLTAPPAKLDTPIPESEPSPSTSSVSSKSECDNARDNRFNKIKTTVKPNTSRNKTMEELITIQRENQEVRRNEFQAMMDLFSKQSKDRHEETLALIKSISGMKSLKKRKRDESSDDD